MGINRGPRRDAWNSNLNGPQSATFTIGAEAANVINVGIQLNSQGGKALGKRFNVRGYLCSDVNGDVMLTNPPNTSLGIGTNGVLIPGTNYAPTSLLSIGTLLISGTATDFKTTTTAIYCVNGSLKTKAATDLLTFSAAHTVTANKFGVFLVQIDAAGTITTKDSGAAQAFNSAALALASLPAPDAGKVALGYIAIAAGAGGFTANTTALTGIATFVDAIPTSTIPLSFTLTSEADGTIDVNVGDTTVRTFYMALVMAGGEIVVSPAITFA